MQLADYDFLYKGKQYRMDMFSLSDDIPDDTMDELFIEDVRNITENGFNNKQNFQYVEVIF
jgi:hypothetical protein